MFERDVIGNSQVLRETETQMIISCYPIKLQTLGFDYI